MKAKLTEQDKADIVRLAAKGKAIAVLAEDFGVTEQAIRYTLKKHKGAAVREAIDQVWDDTQVALKTKERHNQDLDNGLVRVSLEGAHLADRVIEKITTDVARANFRAAAKNLSQAMLRDELTEALAEFFPEKPL
jgi:transposase-like protein